MSVNECKTYLMLSFQFCNSYLCLHDKLLWQRLEHLTFFLKHLHLLLSQRLAPTQLHFTYL